jgi:hypothetical protein
LKREEAILVLKELFEKCTDMDGRYMSLVPPTSVLPIAHGYQIHIKTGLDIITEKCMQDVIDSHNLAMQAFKNEELIIIFKKHESEV